MDLKIRAALVLLVASIFFQLAFSLFWGIGSLLVATSAVALSLYYSNRRLAKEISERSKTEGRLKYRSDFEHLISEMSSRFIGLKTDEIDSHIDRALKDIALFTKADSGKVFLFSEDGTRFSIFYDWHSSQLGDDRARLQNLKVSSMPWWMDRLVSHQKVAISSVSKLYGAACAEKDVITSREIKSVVDVPMSYGGKLVGFLGLSSTIEGRYWTDDEISLLRLAGQIFMSALQRAKADKLLKAQADALNTRTTELEQKAAELEQANVRLQELDRLKSMFIASMSHELRTPLNSIIGFTGIILMGLAGEINAEQNDQLQRVNRAAKHLLALISDVIDVSKIEAGKLNVHVEFFLLLDVALEAIDVVKHEIDKKRLDLVVDVPQDLALRTDRKRVFQVLLNFLTNAVKFTRRGKIEISARTTNSVVEVCVRDTGPGIRPEDIPELFQSFVRLDAQTDAVIPGTGLGLYLSRKIATELLQGAVSVESQWGTGSVFGLRIPTEI